MAVAGTVAVHFVADAAGRLDFEQVKIGSVDSDAI